VTRAVFHPGPFSVTYKQSGRIQRYLMKDGEWEAQPPEDVVAGQPVRRDETGVIQRVVNLGEGDLEADKDQEGGRSKVWP
jgi:hypothetical protein